jgi:small subunit ribosomal protein S16
MLTIKLQRVGKKKQPQFRFVLVEKSRDPFGRAKEILGFYHPRTNPSTIEIKTDRVEYWISKGAQCTETVWNLFVDQGIVKGEKRKSVTLSNTRRAKIEEKSKAAKEAEEAKKAADAAAKEAEAAAKEAEAQAEAVPPAETPAEEAPAEEAKPEEKPAE